MKARFLAWACVVSIVLSLAAQGFYHRPPAPGTVKWKKNSGAGANACPAIADSTVYYVRWKTPGFFDNLWPSVAAHVTAPFRKGPVGVGGARASCCVKAINAQTRQQKWTWDMGTGFVNGPLRAFGDALYVESGSALIALDRKSGKVRWQFAKYGSANVSMLLSDGSLACATPGGKRFFLDAATGMEKPQSAALQADLPLAVVEAEGPAVLRKDALTGKEIWRFALQDPNHAGVRVAGDAVYVNDGRFVWSLDLASGKENWHIDMGRTLTFPVTVSGDNLYFPMSLAGRHFISCADRNKGSQKWRSRVQSAAWSPLILSQGALYFLADDGCLYAMDAEPPAAD